MSERQRRDAYLRRTYGITLEAFEAMLEAQGGGCWVCGCRTGLVLDHNHVTGEPRGIICGRRPNRNCNQALAWFADRPEWLGRAAEYLENPPFRQFFHDTEESP